MPRSPLFVAVTLAVAVLTASASLAASVVVNGQPLPASPPAVEIGGSLLLPVRSVFDALGATVEWNGATETVTATPTYQPRDQFPRNDNRSQVGPQQGH